MYEIVPIEVARQEWERTRETVSEEYAAFVDAILAENPE